MNKKNWWITALDSEENIIEEWLIPNCTMNEMEKETEAAIDNMACIELANSQYVDGWRAREAIITIEIWRGRVQKVSGLPEGWDYEIIDYDSQEVGKPEWNSRA